MFLKLIESELEKLEEIDEKIIDFMLESFDGDYQALKEDFLLEDDEVELFEQLVKRVNSKGQIRKTLSRKIRSRRASLTTGMSKSRLRLRARKSTRTKRRNPMIGRKALRKRKKALRKRKQFGIK